MQGTVNPYQSEIPDRKKNFLRTVGKLILILLLITGSWLWVYLTGGIRYVFSYSMYFGIILAAYYFFIPGGLAAGVIAGLVLGPFMPINVQTAEMQLPFNWIFRMIIFCLIGMLIGGLFQRTHKQMEKIKWMVYHELDTGIPNRSGLIRQLDHIIQSSNDPDHLVLFMVMLNNFREITSVLDVDEINMLNAEIFNRLYPIINEDEKAFQLFPYIFGLIFENVQEADAYEKNCGADL